MASGTPAAGSSTTTRGRPHRRCAWSAPGLGFPQGISGSEPAIRAVAQAERFGAEILLARPLARLAPDGGGYLAELCDGTRIRADLAASMSQYLVDRIAAALQSNGVRALAVATGAAARDCVRELLPTGAEVFNTTSRTC